jgi:ATP-binding cassette subfamily F protein 3
MSVLDYIENIPSSKTTSQLRGLLGSFLFTGDDVYKKIRVLSGGEKARLALCGLLLTPSNVLILDEPTNHLDMFAKDILKKALIEYEGTLILVSHDRDFLSDITDRVLEFTNLKIREFPGDINIYLDQYELIDEKSEKKKKGNKEKYLQQKEFKKKKRSLKKDNDIIENNIKSIEKKINEFNESLNDKSLNTKINYDDYDKLNNELQKEMKKWEEIQLKMEDLDFNDEW